MASRPAHFSASLTIGNELPPSQTDFPSLVGLSTVSNVNLFKDSPRDQKGRGKEEFNENG